MRTSSSSWIVALLPFLLCACPGTRTGNPLVDSDVIVTGSSQAATVASDSSFFHRFILDALLPVSWALPPPSMVDSNGAIVTMSEAWIRLKDIEFKTSQNKESGEKDGDDVKLKGPFAVDLLDSNPTALGEASLTSQAYRRIKFKLHAGNEAVSGAPSELDGSSIYLSASVGGVNFTYLSSDGIEFQIGGSNEVVPEASRSLLLVFRFADLFRQIDLTEVDPVNNSITSSTPVPTSGSACPAIDASASDLYTCFRKGLESTANFGKDQNGDLDLDGDEDTVRD